MDRYIPIQLSSRRARSAKGGPRPSLKTEPDRSDVVLATTRCNLRSVILAPSGNTAANPCGAWLPSSYSTSLAPRRRSLTFGGGRPNLWRDSQGKVLARGGYSFKPCAEIPSRSVRKSAGAAILRTRQGGHKGRRVPGGSRNARTKGREARGCALSRGVTRGAARNR
jgi:hypothetical protein